MATCKLKDSWAAIGIHGNRNNVSFVPGQETTSPTCSDNNINYVYRLPTTRVALWHIVVVVH